MSAASKVSGDKSPAGDVRDLRAPEGSIASLLTSILDKNEKLVQRMMGIEMENKELTQRVRALQDLVETQNKQFALVLGKMQIDLAQVKQATETLTKKENRE